MCVCAKLFNLAKLSSSTSMLVLFYSGLLLTRFLTVRAS